MTAQPTKVRLTASFLERVAATGMTDTAIALAIGVSKQFYQQVRDGIDQPTTRFMAGAVRAGLAQNFAEVAEYVPADEATAA